MMRNLHFHKLSLSINLSTFIKAYVTSQLKAFPYQNLNFPSAFKTAQRNKNSTFENRSETPALNEQPAKG
jgi:hypothetical protein